VETAIRMNALTKQLGMVTNGMDAVLGSMDVNRIGSMMDKFEKQFDSLDVRSGYMESAIAHSTATAVPQEQVDEYLRMVTAQHAVELKDALAVGAHGAVGPYGVGAAAGAAAAPREAVAAGGAPPAAAPPPAAGGAPPPPPGGGGGGSVADSLAARLAALRK
jgi:division protein CdvB (Snf7/Vps24/ESCRT-III family)